MWVKRGSLGLIYATLVETNLGQSLMLSILKEDGEMLLQPRLFRLRLQAVVALCESPVKEQENYVTEPLIQSRK